MKKYIFKLLICAVIFACIGQIAYAADAYVECETGTQYISGRIELGEQTKPVKVTITGYDSENNLNYIGIITAGTDGVAQFCYKNLGRSGDYTYIFDADTIGVTKTVQLNDFIGWDYWNIFVDDMNTLAAANNATLFGERFLAEQNNLSFDLSAYDALEYESNVFAVMLKDYAAYTSVDEIVKAFDRAVVLCGFNENKSVDAFKAIYNADDESDCFGIGDKLPEGINGTIFDDLPTEVQNAVIAEYLKETFEKSSDIAEFLNKHTLLDTIKYADHFGSVKKVIEAYDASGYISVTIDGYIDGVCKKLMGGSLQSFAAVESAFENYRKAIRNSANTAGGGGGSGNSSGLVGGNAVVQSKPSSIAPQPTEIRPGINKGKMYFDDMEDAKWGLTAVNNLYENGIINGVGGNKFAPHKNVTRAEMAKLIASVAGYKENTGASFADVDINAWYYPYISAVCANAIFVGKTDDVFGVNDGITRQEAAVAIYRLVKPYISGNSGQEITNEEEEDVSNIFDTDGDETVYENTFADHNDVAAWAAEAVYALKENGIMSGRSGNTFAPNDTLTRVEAAVLCDSIYEYFKEGIA